MGLFGNLFEKKICSVCGGEIGLLGNRKLEDGNLCKNCAKKLSPWFSDRKNSTVEEIKEQLAYREANRSKVAAFHTSRTFGVNTKVLLDEDAGKFMVTSARNLEDANPDVLDFSDVTGCRIDIDEKRSEVTREDAEGIVNIGLEIEGVQAAALLTEREGLIKCSLRAKEPLDVSAVAAQFGGGGHIRAAGCSFAGATLEEARDRFAQALEGIVS